MVTAVNCGQLSVYPALGIHLLKSPSVLLSAGAAERRSSGKDQRQESRRLGCKIGVLDLATSWCFGMWDEFLRKDEHCE